MRQINFEVDDGPRLTFTADGDQLLFAPRRHAPWPERPRLHKGMTADHLSVPLKPRRNGPDAGMHWIHLKYRDGERKGIAALDPVDLQAAFKGVEEDIGRRFLAETMWGVTAQDLAELGAVVYVPKPSLRVAMQGFFTAPRRTYRLTTGTAKRLEDHMQMASPLALLEEEFQDVTHTMAMCAEYEGVAMALNRERGSNEWAMTPSPFMSDDDFVALIGRHFPGLWRSLYVICRELQAPMDREKLVQLMSAAESLPRLP